MTEAHRPGAIYWLDHAVVPTDDLKRWIQFMHDVVGYTKTWGDEAEVAGGIGGAGAPGHLPAGSTGLLPRGGLRSAEPAARPCRSG